MKKLLYVLLLTFIFFSCANNTGRTDNKESTQYQEDSIKREALFLEYSADEVTEKFSLFTELQLSWRNLKDDKSKQTFLWKKYDDLNSFGAKINDFNDIDNMLVKNDSVFKESIVLKAKSNAAKRIAKELARESYILNEKSKQ